MKILLTGAKGQIGQEVAKLFASPFTLIALGKDKLDVTNRAQVDAVLDQHKPHLVINCAAYTAVDKAESDEAAAYALNRDAVRNLAFACKRNDVPLIHLSTDYVFDGTKVNSYREEDPCAPLNVYGASKLAGEQLLQDIWEKHVILRTSWVFGRYGANFVKTIVRLAQQEVELKIVSDQVGCPTSAEDIAKALLMITHQIQANEAHWGIFHYCGDKPSSWFEFAKLILAEAQHSFQIKTQGLVGITANMYPTPAKRPLNSILDTGKILKAYGIMPSNWKLKIASVLRACQHVSA